MHTRGQLTTTIGFEDINYTFMPPIVTLGIITVPLSELLHVSTNYAMHGVELKSHEAADHSLHYANDLYMQCSFMLE